jgi:hypothetical protein
LGKPVPAPAVALPPPLAVAGAEAGGATRDAATAGVGAAAEAVTAAEATAGCGAPLEEATDAGRTAGRDGAGAAGAVGAGPGLVVTRGAM